MSEEKVEAGADGDATGKTAENPGDQDEGIKTFTQEQLDAAVKSRMTRQAKKYADYGDLKQAASEWEKHKEAQKTEQQKLQDKLEAMETEKNDAIKRANDTIVQSAFVQAATKLGAQFPEDACRLLTLNDFTIGDDGKIDGVDEAVKELVDSGRLPAKQAEPKPPNINAKTGGKQGSGSKMTDEEKQELAAIYGVQAQYVE